MTQKENFKNSRDLQVDDLVYFQKKESELSSPWIMGRVDQIIRSRDGVIRRAVVKYRNSGEKEDRVTDRSVRKLIKLYSVDDPDLQVDLNKVQVRLEELQVLAKQGDGAFGSAKIISLPRRIELCYPDSGPALRCQCCCESHCAVSVHNLYGSKSCTQSLVEAATFEDQAEFNEGVELDQVEEMLLESGLDDKEPDNLTALIMSCRRWMD